MGKENIKIVKKLLLNITSSALFAAILFNAFIILRLHKIVTFFPVLVWFLFTSRISVVFAVYIKKEMVWVYEKRIS